MSAGPTTTSPFRALWPRLVPWKKHEQWEHDLESSHWEGFPITLRDQLSVAATGSALSASAQRSSWQPVSTSFSVLSFSRAQRRLIRA